MPSQAELSDEITRTLLRVINRIQSDSRAQVVERRAGLTLIESEICGLIQSNDGISATELSNVLGVSRSAVSQVAGRLRAKGYIREEQDGQNAKRKRLFLTEIGSKAGEILTNYTRSMAHALYDDRPEELEAYLRFVTKLEKYHQAFRDGVVDLTDNP